MKFSGRKSILFSVLILGCTAFLVGFSVFGMTLGWIAKSDSWILVPFSLVSAFLLWIYFGTHYTLTDAALIYRSGPLRGKIPLNEIREIVKGKTLYTGIKPATAGNGLIIKFRKYDEIYISPDSNNSFVAEILKRNPHILISE